MADSGGAAPARERGRGRAGRLRWVVGNRFLLLVGVGEGPEGELHGELKRGGNGAALAVAPAFWLGGGKERAVWRP